jgi:hypothetical protein
MYDDNSPEDIEIIGWNWQTYTSKTDGKRGIVGNFNAVDGKKIPMFLAIESEKAQYAIRGNLKKLNVHCYDIYFNEHEMNFDGYVLFLNEKPTIPKSITVKKDGNFYKFLKINY